MQAIDRAFHLWAQGFIQVYSHQLLIIVFLIGVIARYLIKQGDGISNAKFIALSVVAGALAVLGVGAAFHTPTIADLLQIKSGAIVEQPLSWIKAIIALGAAGLSVYEGPAHRAEEGPAKALGQRDRALARHACRSAPTSATAISATSNFYHRWEFFHYYLGSKYDRELGYERLYHCAAVAQADSGQANEVRARKLRDPPRRRHRARTRSPSSIPRSAATGSPPSVGKPSRTT